MSWISDILSSLNQISPLYTGTGRWLGQTLPRIISMKLVDPLQLYHWLAEELIPGNIHPCLPVLTTRSVRCRLKWLI